MPLVHAHSRIAKTTSGGSDADDREGRDDAVHGTKGDRGTRSGEQVAVLRVQELQGEEAFAGYPAGEAH